MNDRAQRMEVLLQSAFTPSKCEIVDESAMHAGHAGAASGGGHYRLYLVSAVFEGVGKVGRHRLVYDCLRELMQSEIHALALTLLTPAEANLSVV
jgi:BolA protein